MTSEDLCLALLDAGLILWREGDTLRYKGPSGALTQDLRDLVQASKSDLLRLLLPETRYAAPTSAQRRLWLLQQVSHGVPLYNSPEASCRILGSLELAALRQALDAIVSRHETLRTRFVPLNGYPVQVIRDDDRAALTTVDLRALEPAERQQRARLLLDEACRQPFDLASDPPVRFQLFLLDDEEAHLAAVFQHIASDGWSLGVFMEEFRAAYQAAAMQEPRPWTPIKYSYSEVFRRQCESYDEEAQARDRDYWSTQLKGSSSDLELPMVHVESMDDDLDGELVRFTLPTDLVAHVRSVAREERVTLFMVLMAGLQTLLHRYSGQSDFNVGTPFAGRTIGEADRLIGAFVNTLVIRADVSGDATFRDLLCRVRETCVAAYAHSRLPFDELVEVVHTENKADRSPLFRVMLVLQPPLPIRGTCAGISISPLETATGTAKFDLAVSFVEDGELLHGVIEYRTGSFHRHTMERLSEHLANILREACQYPDRPVSRLAYLSEEERHQLLVLWNDTGAELDPERRIHRLFERQVSATPWAPAVFYGDRMLTYGQLNSMANGIAHRLLEKDITPETLVAVCVDRTPEAIAALLGILKAGGAYVPLDPSYPVDRLNTILKDVGPAVLVMHEAYASRFTQWAFPALCLDHLDHVVETNPEVDVRPDHLAYVIYTSGSTGVPKGVQIEHASVANLIASFQRSYRPGAADRLLQQTSLSFDASVAEIFPLLCSGGALVLAEPEDILDYPSLRRCMARHGVTMLGAVPAVLARLNAEKSLPGGLRLVLSGGETLFRRDVDRLAQVATVTNGYGPTETTVCATFHTLDSNDLCNNAGRIPIGRPIINTKLYILDEHMEPVPVGVPGELYIGGAGLSRGYLHRQDLTDTAFVQNPFTTQRERLYRTGDRARFRPDGEIEYLGRLDRQVKIRGHRIELEEIESHLRTFPGVQSAAVVLRPDAAGEMAPAAYVVAGPGDAVGATSIRSHLESRLPAFMVPKTITPIERLPLLPNGKVDLHALPEPDTMAEDPSSEVVSAFTPLETALAALWASVLGTSVPGRSVSFFDLGGHSLQAAQVVALVRRDFDVEVPLRLFLEKPTIEALAWAVEEAVLAQIEAMPDEAVDASTNLTALNTHVNS